MEAGIGEGKARRKRRTTELLIRRKDAMPACHGAFLRLRLNALATATGPGAEGPQAASKTTDLRRNWVALDDTARASPEVRNRDVVPGPMNSGRRVR